MTEPDPDRTMPQSAKMLRLGTDIESLIKAWGEPIPDGPGDSILKFRSPAGEQVWISSSKSAPSKVARALIIDRVDGSALEVFNSIELTKSRKCDQISKKQPTALEISDKWGPPDQLVGSGFPFWLYKMADGRFAMVRSNGDQIIDISCD